MKNEKTSDAGEAARKYLECRKTARALGLRLELEGPGGEVRRFVVVGNGRRVPLTDLEVLAGYLSGYRDASRDDCRKHGKRDASQPEQPAAEPADGRLIRGKTAGGIAE
jgi:hypothetical protein